MNGVMDKVFFAGEEIQEIMAGSKTAEEKLALLRAQSNIKQALVNLLNQCRASEGFENIEAFAELQLRILERNMFHQIHDC